MARKPRRTPAEPPAPEAAAPPFDGPMLVAVLRRGDQAEIRRAYRQVFGGEVGRLVLAHALKEAGVGVVRPRDMGAEERAYMDGAAFAVLSIAELADFDQASVLVGLASGVIEGTRDDRSANFPRGGSGPDEDEF